MEVRGVNVFGQGFQRVRGEEVFTCCLVVGEAAEGVQKFLEGGRVVQCPVDGVVNQEVEDSRVEGNVVPGENMYVDNIIFVRPLCT